ncbi:S-layer homology domain-containing protein [Bacillus sp. AK128]
MRKAICLFMSLFLVLILGKEVNAEVNLIDLPLTHSASEEIQYLIEKDVITGYPDGTFRPNQPVKRIQAITMLGRALKWDASNLKEPAFVDIEKGTEAYGYISVAVQKGIINDSTKFNPNGTLTRAQMAKVLSKAFDLPIGKGKNYTDVANNHWAREYIDKLTFSKVTTGYPDNSYKPEFPTTRVQFSLFIARALDPKFKEGNKELSVKASELGYYNHHLYSWCDGDWYDTYDYKNCVMTLEGTEHQVTSLPVGEIAVWKDQFFIQTEFAKIISSDAEGKQVRTIVDANKLPEEMETIYITDMNVTANWIYFSVSSNSQFEGAIYKVKHDGSQLTKIHNKPNMELLVSEDELWFQEEFYEGWLTKLNTQTGKKTEFKIPVTSFTVEDDLVFYVENKGDHYPLYKMNRDGSGKELLDVNVNPNSDIFAKDSFIYYAKGWENPTLYKKHLVEKKEIKLVTADNGINIYGIWEDALYLYTNHGENMKVNLATNEVNDINLHQYIEPEITTNSLVQHLNNLFLGQYEIVVGDNHPETDAIVLIEGKKAMNVAFTKDDSRELWINIYDTSDQSLNAAIEILRSYNSNFNEEEVIGLMKSSLSETITNEYKFEDVVLYFQPATESNDLVKLLFTADLY